MNVPDLQLSPIERTRTHEAVVRQIVGEIYSGRLQPGDRLPGERQLSNMLSVSRASVREALRVLEALEIVTVRPGSGPESGPTIASEPGDGMSHLLRLHVALSHFSFEEVIDTRVLIEAWAARAAALNAKTEDLASLESLVEQMTAPDLTRRDFMEIDTEFHLAVAAASGNRLVHYLMSAVRGTIQQRMLEGFELVDDWKAIAERLVGEHRQVLKGIRARDADTAEIAVRDHIVGFYSGLSTRQDGTDSPEASTSTSGRDGH